jgi:hypothetical protein
MDDIKTQFTEIYRNQFIGKSISRIEINMISDEYVEYEQGKTWLTEGGVEFKFEDDTLFSFSYDTETLQFICVESDLLPFVSDYDYYPIDLSESQDYYDVLENTIVDLNIDWVDFNEIDYAGNIISSEPFPISFILTFQDKSTIQIASVVSKLNGDTHKFSLIRYNLEGTILISFNNIIPIDLN